MIEAYHIAIRQNYNLSNEHHKHLWCLQNNGDKIALEKLVLCCGGLIMKHALKIKRAFPQAELDDLIQEGNEGVIRAIHTFNNKRKETKFISYVSNWIRGRQWLYVRKRLPLVDSKLDSIKRGIGSKMFYKMYTLIDIINTWDPDIKNKKREEFTNKIKIPIEVLFEAEVRVRSRESVELMENDNKSFQPIHILDNIILIREVNKLVDALPEKNRTVIKERFLNDDPPTSSQLARKLRVHKNTIDQRQMYGLKYLKEACDKNQIIQEMLL